MTGWIPMRWPAGPLELARRKSSAGAREDILQGWVRPETLDLVTGTPVNCLVVAWAAGGSDDEEQQRRLGPLITAARSKDLAVVGHVLASGTEAALQRATAAKLDAVLLEGNREASDLNVIPLAGRSHVSWNADSPLLAIQENAWPGVKEAGGVDETLSGPTRAAWIDSNGWYVNLARAMAPGKGVWLQFDPPFENEIIRPESYVLAVADSESAGARWIVSLDDQTGSALLKRASEGMQAWQSLCRALRFFEKQPKWQEYRPAGVVGVLSDFSGDNEFLSFELLNLLARRQLPCRVLEMRRLKEFKLDDFKAIVCMDQPPPAGELRERLLEFVRNGGLLLAGKSWPAEGKLQPGGEHPRFSVRLLRGGRLAVSTEDSPDPYLLALDAHMLLSRANDLYRLYNVSSVVTNLAAAPAASSALLHILNFSARSGGHPPVIWLQKPYSKARFWCIEKEEAEPLPMAAEMGGVAIHLPRLSSYAALELES